MDFQCIDRFKQLSKGKTHFLAVTYDQMVYSWGATAHGQLGIATAFGTSITIPTLVDSSRKNFTKACAGDRFSVFLLNNGLVMTCGRAASGCLGAFTKDDYYVPKLVDK